MDAGFSNPFTKESNIKLVETFLEDYILMADFLNHILVNVVNIQHEFGIFGGESGEYICNFLSQTKKACCHNSSHCFA